MSTEKLSDIWLFELNSKEEIKYWVNNLDRFHFKRAWGGHAGDGDEFSLSISYNDENDLIEKLDKLDIELKAIPNDWPRFIPGKPYPAEEYDTFKSEIDRFPNLEQPGRCEIFGEEVFVWVYNNYFNITISGSADKNYYQVTIADFEKSKRIEEIILKLGLSNYIYRGDYYVCSITKDRYPELFE